MKRKAAEPTKLYGTVALTKRLAEQATLRNVYGDPVIVLDGLGREICAHWLALDDAVLYSKDGQRIAPYRRLENGEWCGINNG